MTSNSDAEILLGDDNEDDAELTIRALKKANMAKRLVHVKDGAEALDFIFSKGAYSARNASHFPRLILLDIKMPKVDGIEVLKQIKTNEATRNIPVVIMTSSKEQADIIMSYHLGANSYVVKPVEFENFVKAVSAIGLYWLLVNESAS